MSKPDADLSSLPSLPNEARDLIELKRRGRAIIVPTDDSEVRSQLRQLKQPVSMSLFLRNKYMLTVFL